MSETERQELEAEIRRLIQTETHPTRLSNRLFSPPEGLFCRIGMPLTEAERRVIASGELFKAAQQRVHELERAWLDSRRLPATLATDRAAAQSQPAETVGA